MIQRIQSIYLLLAAIFMAVTAFSPLLVLIDETILFSCGVKDEVEIIKPTWGIISMVGLSTLLSLITIFMFKKRKVQSKMIGINIFVVLFYYVTATVYLTLYYGSLIGSINSVAYGIFCPVIVLIFLLLANRAIKKDEKLVRSTERIR